MCNKAAVIVLLFCAGVAECGNILWLAGLASPSHQLWSGPLQKALASRGHNITALSVDIESAATVNLTFIYMENVYDHLFKNKSLSNMKNNSPMEDINDLAHFRSESCVPAFTSKGVKLLMDYPRSFKFDLVVHDFAGSQCLLGFVPRFGNPPLIAVSASTCPVGISAASGNPQYPAFIPANHLSVGYSMSLLTRLYNVLLYVYDNAVREFVMMPRQSSWAREYFSDATLDVGAISRSSLFTLVNLAPADVMQPFFQTVVPVGGIHILQPKPLEQELNNFIEGSEDGVVYFALGTNIKSEHFTSAQVKYFLDAFKRFPSYRFVWKYDPSRMIYALSKNVMIRKWMPQNDILAHPKVKVFLGHGGALGLQEASWHGVPQLLMPFIIDQKHNAARAAQRGVALVLDKDHLSADIIAEALDQVLHNPRTKVASLSRSFRDQPEPPMERAVFWMEYAMRHQDPWLRSPAQSMPAAVQAALDVVLVLICIVSAVAAIIYFALRTACLLLYKTKEKLKRN